MSKTDELIEEVETLKIQINGDPRDESNKGVLSNLQDQEARLSSLEHDKKIVSGVMLIAFIAVCTYFFSMLTDGINTSNNDIHSYNMDSNSQLFRRGESGNNINDKQYESN